MTITSYCYSDKVNNVITYSNGFKSLNSFKNNNYGYYINFDEKGNIVKITIKNDNYAIVLLNKEEINEKHILSLTKDDFNSNDAAYKYINRCPNTSI